MIELLACIITALVFLLCISLFFNFKHAKVIINVEDAVSESLDIMDESYRKTQELLNTPLLFDSYEVRQMINQAKHVRDAILYVSNSLAGPFGGVIEEDVSELDESEEII